MGRRIRRRADLHGARVDRAPRVRTPRQHGLVVGGALLQAVPRQHDRLARTDRPQQRALLVRQVALVHALHALLQKSVPTLSVLAASPCISLIEDEENVGTSASSRNGSIRMPGHWQGVPAQGVARDTCHVWGMLTALLPPQ